MSFQRRRIRIISHLNLIHITRVMGNIEIHLPTEIRSTDILRRKSKFNTLIGNLSPVHRRRRETIFKRQSPCPDQIFTFPIISINCKRETIIQNCHINTNIPVFSFLPTQILIRRRGHVNRRFI